ncbi:MAG: SURF1 family protein [Oceanicaulis sp.]
MTFRPYPVLTLFTLAGLALLLWLGSWQMDRRAWKQDLLADFAATRDAPPVTLDEAFCQDAAAPGRAFDADGSAVSPRYVRVYGVGPQGGPGWRVFAPVSATECAEAQAILAEVRFDPLDTARAGASGVAAASEAVDALRFERPLRPGPFTPTSAEDGFYAYDPGAMAEALELPAEALTGEWWLARDTGEPPAHLTQTPPERHLAYAITWFLMAIALIGVYAAFHLRAGRLRLRRR